MSLTEKQLEQRLGYVTGSDVAAIFGKSKWQTSVDIWRQKTRREVAEDISEKPNVKAGILLEPVVREWFKTETGKVVKEQHEILQDPDKMFIHPKHNWMAANIDGFIPEENAVLEIKTSMFGHGWGKDGENTIPDHYLLQVAHYCEVLQADKAYIAVLIGGCDFRIYTYQKNLKLQNVIVEKTKKFWFENVKADVVPEPRTEDDVIALYGNNVSDDAIQSTEQVELTATKYKELKSQEKAMQLQIKELRNELTAYMADKQILLGSNGKALVTWKVGKGRASFDSTRFKADYPDLYTDYIKTKPIRTFLVK